VKKRRRNAAHHVSDAIVAKLMPAAVATPEPRDENPGVRLGPLAESSLMPP
jgi:hypothetical protein